MIIPQSTMQSIYSLRINIIAYQTLSDPAMCHSERVSNDYNQNYEIKSTYEDRNTTANKDI